MHSCTPDARLLGIVWCGSCLQSLPEIRSASRSDWDEFAAQKSAKHYADKAAALEREMDRTRGVQEVPETSDARAYKSPYELAQMEAKKRSTGRAPVPVAAFAHVSGGTL